MKLKDGLILREVAGQFVIVPTGKRVREFSRIHYMTADAAYLWNQVYGKEFTLQDIENILREKYPDAAQEAISEQADKFVTGIRSLWLEETAGGGIAAITYKKKSE